MKAFSGIRIVEFAQVIAGPLAAELLGFLGADVIKIESPGHGDQARRLMDNGPLAKAGMAPLYQGLNANKRTITLDLKHPDAKAIVHRLVERADVVIENYRPGVMRKLGFGYEALKQVRPDIVYCSVSGFGQEGPRKDAPAYDGAIQAAAGMMIANGPDGIEPSRVPFALVDVTTGLTAAFAISSALFRRQQTGEGQYLDVAMFDTALFLQQQMVLNYVMSGTPATRTGNEALGRVPTRGEFPTADGQIQITAITKPQVQALANALGIPELMEDPRFASMSLQVQHGAELREVIIEALSGMTAAEWETILNAGAVPASRVMPMPDVLADPHMAYRDIIQRMSRQDGSGTIAVTPGFKASADGPSATTPAPLKNQDTEAVLAELGYSAEEIAALADRGAVER